MKKKYVTPETELQFILTKDIVTFSQIFDDDVDPHANDYSDEDWEIKKTV